MKKIYNIKLTTLGPVFIGSGQSLRKNQYLYYGHEKRVAIIDEVKLVESLMKAGKYNDFLTGVSQNRVHDLKNFLDRCSINPSPFILYDLPFNAYKNTRSNLNDLKLFMRNGQNEAYIPGSSLKGALRTCLLLKLTEDKKDNQMFKSLSISDSDIIRDESFEIYQKVDFTSPKKQPSSLSLYRECIKPGTCVNFMLSLGEGLTISQLKKEIRETYISYHNNWASRIRSAQEHPNLMGDRLLIYLGGGPGFVSKTLHYKEKPPQVAKRSVLEILKKKFPVYKKIDKPQNAPMAVKLAPSAAGDLEMGLCELIFDEVDMRL